MKLEVRRFKDDSTKGIAICLHDEIERSRTRNTHCQDYFPLILSSVGRIFEDLACVTSLGKFQLHWKLDPDACFLNELKGNEDVVLGTRVERKYQ